MLTQPISERARGLGAVALALGILGIVFYWWTPLGLVLSLTGLVTGWVGWLNAARPSRNRGLAIAGTLISIVAFVLDLVIAIMGLEWIQLMPYR
ncbi:MAG TPA: hypothetical protein VKU02_31840 [Gemmataceae bacterium]|nr:hypothetical protein [Gemmataceae bacterium]